MTSDSINIFPGFSRPEYPGPPEALLSALVWREIGSFKGTGWKAKHGLTFRELQTGSSLTIEACIPSDDPMQNMPRFEAAIRESGIFGNDAESIRQISSAILNSLNGVLPSKAKAICAIPFSPATALLQDSRGVTRKNGPADYGEIISQLYAFGGEAHGECASSQFLRALEHPHELKLYDTIDMLVRKGLGRSDEFLSDRKVAPNRLLTGAPAWLHKYEHLNPYSWFRENWDLLCDPLWINALPPRRWVDWCTCVVRAALGFGFLWEARFYDELMTGVLSPGEEREHTLRRATGAAGGLFRWQTHASVSLGDVASTTKRTIHDGVNARSATQYLNERLKDAGVVPSFDNPDALSLWFDAARSLLRDDRVVRDHVITEMEMSWSGRHENTRESINYALQCRERFGPNADYYGFLMKNGRRYTLVRPSPEWLVVIASLAAGKPGGTTRLSGVWNKLRQLGVEADLSTLTCELEAAGLCSSVQDADQGLEVASGF